MEQEKGIKKLFIEDWKRTGYGYETAFEGECYHLVKDRNDTNYRIQANHREVQEQSPALHNVTKFGTKVGRKTNDYLLSCNDSRFENINKSPSVISQSTHTPGFSFSKHSERVNDLFQQNMYYSRDNFGKTDSGGFYDSKKDKIMKRLDAGIPNMRKLQSRDSIIRSPMASTQLSVSCIDMDRAIKA